MIRSSKKGMGFSKVVAQITKITMHNYQILGFHFETLRKGVVKYTQWSIPLPNTPQQNNEYSVIHIYFSHIYLLIKSLRSNSRTVITQLTVPKCTLGGTERCTLGAQRFRSEKTEKSWPGFKNKSCQIWMYHGTQ